MSEVHAQVTPSPSNASSDANGWMETQKKKRPNAQRSTLDLPLDWTRVKRRSKKSKRSGDNGDGANDDGDDCCLPSKKIMDELFLQQQNDQELIKGHAIICLLDRDPKWFQGYFFPGLSSSSDSSNVLSDDDGTKFISSFQKPWGLLAVQQELDDCEKCADGGFRRVSLTVFPFPETEKEIISDIDWTGGDMMCLTGEKASLQADKLFVENDAVPHVERFFDSIVKKVITSSRDDDDNDDEQPCGVLDLFPDIAIITGSMKLVLSTTKKVEDA